MVTASDLVHLTMVCLIHGLMSQDVTGCHRMSQHLVNEHQRVGGLSLLQALDDLAGHGSNLDFTMSSINPCTSSPAQVGACDFLVENEGCIN